MEVQAGWIPNEQEVGHRRPGGRQPPHTSVSVACATPGAGQAVIARQVLQAVRSWSTRSMRLRVESNGRGLPHLKPGPVLVR